MPQKRNQVLKNQKALGVDADLKVSNLKRLRRIEGQIRGLHKMVEDERYCADILVQVASVQVALRGVQRGLMRNHLKQCVTNTLRQKSSPAVEKIHEEVLDLMFRHVT